MVGKKAGGGGRGSGKGGEKDRRFLWLCKSDDCLL